MSIHPFSTKGLTGDVRAALATFNTTQKGGRVRSLSAEDTAQIVAAARLGLRCRRPDDHTLTVSVYGGFVPNSYKWSGDCDTALLTIDLLKGSWKINVWRGATPRRPFGKGDRVLVRLLRGEQRQGRLVLR